MRLLGSYNTPRLLELSGVGDPKILKGVSITPIIELPGVGANLQEHPFIISDFVVKDTVFTFGRCLRGAIQLTGHPDD